MSKLTTQNSHGHNVKTDYPKTQRLLWAKVVMATMSLGGCHWVVIHTALGVVTKIVVRMTTWVVLDDNPHNPNDYLVVKK
jgi:hypothetical protein